MNNDIKLCELLGLPTSLWSFYNYCVDKTYVGRTKERLLDKVSKDFTGVDEDWYESFTEHKLDFNSKHNTMLLLEFIHNNIQEDILLQRGLDKNWLLVNTVNNKIYGYENETLTEILIRFLLDVLPNYDSNSIKAEVKKMEWKW